MAAHFDAVCTPRCAPAEDGLQLDLPTLRRALHACAKRDRLDNADKINPVFDHS